MNRIIGPITAAVLIGCSGRLAMPRTSVILVGQVVDLATSRPLDLALVSLADLNTYTTVNADGAFTFRVPRPSRNSIQIVVRRIGYQRSTIRVQLTPDSIQNVGSIVLHPGPIQYEATTVERKPE